VKLPADLKPAHERLERNPHNSSRPPSSMALWDRAGDDAAATSWFEHGQLLRLWVFTSAATTVLTIGRRSANNCTHAGSR
jgi:hypothetical protein